jgi:hypothetical protein
MVTEWYMTIDLRKFSSSPNEAARLMKCGENSKNKQIIYHAKILFVDQ